MSLPVDVDCITVEFSRFGGEKGTLTADSQYIRTAGYDHTVADIKAELDQRDFLLNMSRLRYRKGTTVEQINAARQLLASHAERFLPKVTADHGLMQIDIVTKAAELWVFPFEAWFAQHADQLESADKGIVITRRIRGDFAADTRPWPDKPRVLFVHAPSAGDLEQSLIDEHTNALCRALEPWAAGGDPTDPKKGLLTVFETSASVQEFKDAVKAAPYDFIHILAHGAKVPGEIVQDDVWGLRLGSPAADAVHPKEIADALAPTNGRPLVVTMAACDSGNQEEPAMGNYSVIQELHRCGVPIVIGSQLPLTKPGSVDFAQAFYRPLFEGTDVRAALHAGRVAVRKGAKTDHDWMSIVAYVRLPAEGYAQYLQAFGLRSELGILKALQTAVDDLIINGGSEAAFDSVETLLVERISSLSRRFLTLKDQQKHDLGEECGGLLASAHKRHAELLFTRAGLFPSRRNTDLSHSRAALQKSLDFYRETFRTYPQSHWNGMQQLALELALTGKVANPSDWDLVRTFAEHVRDHQPKDYWASGTLIEALFIQPLVGKPRDAAAIRAEIATLRARSGGDPFSIESTRRQLKRYEVWWTNASGFFPGVHDLADDAKPLLMELEAGELG